jgi:modulator of FtsH protease HflC
VGHLAITPAASERRPVARFAAVILSLAPVADGGRVCYFVVGDTEYAIVTDFGNPTQVVTSPDLGFKYPHQASEPSTVDSSMLRLQRVSDIGEDAGRCGWNCAATGADPRRYFETVLDRADAESRSATTSTTSLPGPRAATLQKR